MPAGLPDGHRNHQRDTSYYCSTSMVRPQPKYFAKYHEDYKPEEFRTNEIDIPSASGYSVIFGMKNNILKKS